MIATTVVYQFISYLILILTSHHHIFHHILHVQYTCLMTQARHILKNETYLEKSSVHTASARDESLYLRLNVHQIHPFTKANQNPQNPKVKLCQVTIISPIHNPQIMKSMNNLRVKLNMKSPNNEVPIPNEPKEEHLC